MSSFTGPVIGQSLWKEHLGEGAGIEKIFTWEQVDFLLL